MPHVGDCLTSHFVRRCRLARPCTTPKNHLHTENLLQYRSLTSQDGREILTADHLRPSPATHRFCLTENFMATLDLTDDLSPTVSATLRDDSVLGKTPKTVLHFVRTDVLGALHQTLDQVQINSVALGFTFQPTLTLKGGSATFTTGGGFVGELDLLKPPAGAPSPLFPQDQFGSVIGMGKNYYLAAMFQVAPSAPPTATEGAFTFTLTASATGNAKLFFPFGPNATGMYPTLLASLETLLSNFKLPTAMSDTAPWPVGSVFTFRCQGSLAFNASFNVLAAVNPTASPGFSAVAGPIAVTAGPSLTLAGGFKLFGEFEARLWKRTANIVQLGYYKKQGKSFRVAFSAAEAADVTLGGFDVIAKLYALLGDTGKLDAKWLENNVPKDQAANVAAAYGAAVQQKLSVELDAACDTTFADQAAFSWDFDLSTAGGTAQQALTDALRGEVAPLLEGEALPAGVTAVGSILDSIRETKRTFNLNFLGLFDHATVNDAVLDLQAKTTEDGQLILTDTAHVRRLAADATPFVKSDKLRSVLVEDGTATVSYAASFGKVVPKLSVKYLYFDFKSRAQPADLEGFLKIASGVTGKDATGPWSEVLSKKLPSQNASIEAALTYDVSAASTLFLNPGGSPRPSSDYAAAIRSAIFAMPPEPALDPVFLAAVGDDTTWQALLNAGSLDNIYAALGVSISTPPTWAKFAAVWVSQAALWPPRMHAAGGALQAVAQYLQAHPNDDLQHDAGFQNLRQNFANHVKTAIQGAPVFGDDASGLLILFHAAKPTADSVTIAYAGKTVTYP